LLPATPITGPGELRARRAPPRERLLDIGDHDLRQRRLDLSQHQRTGGAGGGRAATKL
jgi:hypothetical protein